MRVSREVAAKCLELAGEQPAAPKPPKYRNQPVWADGIRFASKREAKRYGELKALESAGAISELRLQVTFRLVVNGHKICRYVADFVYTQDGRQITEDCKGFRTREYRLKRKLMRAVYGIEIRET